MSYTSDSKLGTNATLAQVRELIVLLGYKRADDVLKVPDRTDYFFWFDPTDYRSHTGVELDLFRRRRGRIAVQTRSRVGRSYWDLVHQNKTLKLLRGLLGGHFTTDAGRNRYWRPEGKPPSPESSGCFLARWRFHNALGKVLIYRSTRQFEAPIAREEPTGLPFVDEWNPRLFSNNLILPYAIAIWEEYFKFSFTALLKHSKNRQAAIKRASLPHGRLEAIAGGQQSVEEACAASLSFQRPSAISEHFKLLDPKLDLSGVLKKPYRRRKVSLFSSIEKLVEERNVFVHSGAVSTDLTDKKLETTLRDLEVAVDRAYMRFGEYAGFSPSRDY